MRALRPWVGPATLPLLIATRFVAATPAHAAPMDDPALTTCSVIVTGTDARDRPDGIRRCLLQVVVKLTGDPALADDPRVARLLADPRPLIRDLLYLDRETDEAHRDEQGSRDRPFDLIVHAEPAALIPALAAAGLPVWTAPRPTLLLLVTVRGRRGDRYVMAGDGDDGEPLRQALVAAGTRFGLPVALPEAGDLAAGDLRPDSHAAALAARPGIILLRGTLDWTEADAGWDATWHLAGDPDPWSVRGVSFDAAFRDAVGGALARLARRR